MSLHLVPVTFAEACGFTAMWHRHHAPPTGMKFTVGAADETGALVGVAITGRPVARHLDDGATLEVTRVATDGTANACSMLYAACWRAAVVSPCAARPAITSALAPRSNWISRPSRPKIRGPTP